VDEIEMFNGFFRLHSNLFRYKITYKSIIKLFLLESVDDMNQLLIVGLDPPIRAGATSYPYILMQLPTHKDIELELNMEEEEFTKPEYKDLLAKNMHGTYPDVVCRIFKALTHKKVMVPGSFKSHHGLAAVRCSYKTNDGYLYILEKSFFFVKRPPTYIRHEMVVSVAFKRLNNRGVSNRTFDLELTLKSSPVIAFTSINRSEYAKLFEFLHSKKLNILNLKEHQKHAKSIRSGRDRAARHYDVEDPYIQKLREEAGENDGGDSDEGDEDFVAQSSESDAEEYEEMSQNSSDSELGIPLNDADDDRTEVGQEAPMQEVSEEDVEVLPKATKKRKKPSKKKKSKIKRPLSAFMFFGKDERSVIVKEMPQLSFAQVGRELGVRWKALPEERKQKYIDLNKADKVRYAEAMKNAPPESSGDENAAKPARKKKKVRDPNCPKRPKSAYFFFMDKWRQIIATENPTMAVKDRSKLLGAKWNSLSDAEKQPFKNQFLQAKEEYKIALAKYEAEKKVKEAALREKQLLEGGTVEEVSKKEKKKKKKEKKKKK